MCSAIGQGRAGHDRHGRALLVCWSCRVWYHLFCFVNYPTQPKPLIVQPYPTFGTPLGSVVPGREEWREVMGRIVSLGMVSTPLTLDKILFPIITGSINSSYGTYRIYQTIPTFYHKLPHIRTVSQTSTPHPA